MAIPMISVKRLHFDDYDGSEFERLTFAYHLCSDRWESLEWYGQVGSDQGRDIWGSRTTDRGTETVCIQCANRKRLELSKAKLDIDSMVKASNGRPDRVRFVCGGNLSANVRDRIKDYATASGILECDIWSGAEFEERLRRDAESLLRRFVDGIPFPDSPDELAQLAQSAERCDGNPSKESIDDHLSRIMRKIDFGFQRKTFLNSAQGVESAAREYHALLRDIESIAKRHGMSISGAHGDKSVVFHGKWLVVSWVSQYPDALQYSCMRIELWDNEPETFGSTEAHQVENERYQSDIDVDGNTGWRLLDEDEIISSLRLAEAWLTKLADCVAGEYVPRDDLVQNGDEQQGPLYI